MPLQKRSLSKKKMILLCEKVKKEGMYPMKSCISKALRFLHFVHILVGAILFLLSIVLYPSYGKGIGYFLTVLFPLLYIGVGLLTALFPQLFVCTLVLLDCLMLYKSAAFLDGFLISYLLVINLCSLWIAYTGIQYRKQRKQHDSH